ncbi:acyl-CoA dehydrogenase family protein [Cellvibrio japonicus]|uniref:Acyl-CoA dehydrogenase n=1 Tax=Cellvibrio japonicus (strain Ueda107) TaxID=498211 RepID=B3PI06_CELJU|nr:acyl-CoA dehydrogenase family protein [Cellvibrio japonicus]ACE84445.1 conserved hypothetical protein [Cellvibrio japonicus Ueda107]QEI13938.1 acyl-CoA dehydrogenase [Cellvibrio japonicus]QEI17512.1 acyl-CoA dehydrogenase [Cellvibrio japonicus]QEI21088.1 acyl-CoA dehydrogenase [Cellvibrio japonicus]
MSWNLSSHFHQHQSVQRLDELIAGKSITDLEALSPGALKEIIKVAQLANIIIPVEYGGQGKNLIEALDILQYVAKRSPSLGIILCMHYHVVATIVAVPQYFAFSDTLLRDVATHNKLLASAFAEGTPNLDIFTSSVKVTALGNGKLSISGFKKPCTMAGIADYYAVSVVGDDDLKGVAVIDGRLPGISQKPFWPSPLLKAADSNQVLFDRVEIPETWALLADEASMTGVLSIGLAMFNLMINVAYTGVSAALTEKLPVEIASQKHLYIDIYGKLLQSYYSAVGLALRLDDIEQLENTLNQILVLRYQNQMTLKNLVGLISEHVGSYVYLSDPEFALLASISNLISFHPLNRKTYENS